MTLTQIISLYGLRPDQLPSHNHAAGLEDAIKKLLEPIVEGLQGLKEPSGVYSKDPLTHANNTIINVSMVANDLLLLIEYKTCKHGHIVGGDGCFECADCGRADH